MKTKAVIYARVSSVNDRQDTTRQIEDLKRYALLQDIEIVRIFQEHISGAKKIEERQVLTECLEYCTEKGVDYLLLSELSRLGRSTLQVLRSLDILHEAKVSVYIQNLGLYTLQPNGEANPIASIMVTVLAEMANIERANIQYRLNSGRANYIAKGGKLGRKAGSIKTEERKREEYRETIALLKKGYSVRNIAKLQGIGVSTVQRVKNQFIRM
jgi:DNA invertase Pin-like site-specific DNA recombinase